MRGLELSRPKGPGLRSSPQKVAMSPIKYMRHIIALLAATAPAALGGISATVSSSDLIKKPAFDNIKAVWDSDLTLAGSKAKLSLAYDFKAKKDFVKEVAVAGAVADIKYAVTHAISSGVTGLTLMTKQMGHNLKVVGDSSDCVTQIAASGSCSVGDFDVSYTPSYQIKKKLSKLSLSAALGHGLSASGTLSATTAGEVGADYEVGYDTSLGEVCDRTAAPPLCFEAPSVLIRAHHAYACARICSRARSPLAYAALACACRGVRSVPPCTQPTKRQMWKWWTRPPSPERPGQRPSVYRLAASPASRCDAAPSCEAAHRRFSLKAQLRAPTAPGEGVITRMLRS